MIKIMSNLDLYNLRDLRIKYVWDKTKKYCGFNLFNYI